MTGRRPPKPPDSIRPPWSRAASVAAACTGCGACVPACPQSIIRADAAGRPSLSFSLGECTLCGRCAESCPEPVFDRAQAPFAHVALIEASCFAARAVVCQSCGDACPDGAIRFRPRLGGPALPELSTDRCNGCGACIAACPAKAIATQPRPLESAHV